MQKEDGQCLQGYAYAHEQVNISRCRQSIFFRGMFITDRQRANETYYSPVNRSTSSLIHCFFSFSYSITLFHIGYCRFCTSGLLSRDSDHFKFRRARVTVTIVHCQFCFLFYCINRCRNIFFFFFA